MMDLAPRLRRALERPVRARVVPPPPNPDLVMAPAAPLPADEKSRVATVRALELLDAEAGRELQALVQLAAQVCDAPMAALVLVDSARVTYAASVGIPALTLPRDKSL